MEIHAFRVDPRILRFRVVSATSGKRDTVRSITRQEGLILGVNASYFDEKERPLGLLIDKGKKIQKLRNVDWGVFQVTKAGAPTIVHARDYVVRPDTDAAVQAGPRLVVDGKVLKLKPQIARRTAVCVDRSERVVLVVTEGGLFLRDIAELMAKDVGSGGLGCKNALNLDGGPSTQAAFTLGTDSWDLYGGSSVPVVLGIQPREEVIKP